MTETVMNHSCPSCGGQMIINEERKLYECPFCNSTYDYEYFREDDVIEKGCKALAAGEYKSAGEAFRFLLGKEPHNFMALRGSIFASANISSLKDLQAIDSIDNIPYESIKNAVDNCEPENKEYFNELKEAFDIEEDISKSRKAIENYRREKRDREANAKHLNSQMESLKYKEDLLKNKLSPMFMFLATVIIAIVIFAVELIIAVNIGLGEHPARIVLILAVVPIIIILISGFICIPNWIKLSKLKLRKGD